MRNKLLFDLDGTIVDSAPGITASVRYALDKMNKPSLPQDVLHQFVGPPLGDSFLSFAGFAPEEVDQGIHFFREYFKEKGIYENSLFEGIDSMLQLLYQEGKQIYLATSKPIIFAQQLLERYKISSYFDGVVGSSLDGSGSPKEEIVGTVLKQYHIQAQEALMVGDTVYDIQGSAAHGIPCVAVLHGGVRRDVLEDAGAAYIAASVPELQELLFTLTA